jgi:peptide/nickel transport system permease protein
MVDTDRLKEKFRAYRKVFKQNWDLFKASKIGVLGIIIVLFFLGMAIIAPFLSLRDPINWRAPDADVIRVNSWWGIGRDVSTRQWNAGDPINHTVSFRVKPAGAQALESDRVYFTSGNKLFSLKPSNAGSYWTDGASPENFDFPHITDATFSTDVVVANFGNQYDPDEVDYMLGVGTNDGYIYLIEDYDGDITVPREPTPSVANGRVYIEQLDVVSPSAITSAALYSNPTLGRAPSERFYFGTEDGYLYAYSVSKLDNEDWTYASGDWTSMPLVEGEIRPSPRTNHSMAYDSINERIVLFGGFDGLLNDETWIYDPVTQIWTKIDTDPHPSARAGHSMTFDSNNGNVILFGGVIDDWVNPRSNETWTFDVSTNTWTLMSPPTPPEARAFSAMSYDTDAGMAVLFGGDRNSSETWTYAGGDWTQMTPLSQPSDRFGHAMVYDTTSRVTVLFGGSDNGSETWTYDSTLDDWSVRSPTQNPSSRMFHAMVYDNANNQVVLFGGDSGWQESWTYDVGGDWTELAPISSPSGRSGHSMVYDSLRSEIFLFGGDDRQFSRLWFRHLSMDDPVIMAGFPLNTPTDPNYSPALNKDGDMIFVNDGGLHAIYTSNASDVWSTPSLDMGETWTIPPVVALEDRIGPDFVEAVYATTDHGWIYARYINNGSSLASWEERGLDDNKTATSGGIPIKIDTLTFDGGVLTTPDFFGNLIYVGSSSGYAYAIRRDPLPGNPAGSIVWKYSDRILLNAGFGFTGGVRFSRESRLLFAVGYEGYTTPKDLDDDVGTLFTLGEDGNLSWRKSFEGRIGGTPTIWKDNEGTHPTPTVWFGTSEAIANAYSSTGENKAPLPPGCYDSGNCYTLGTDAQGRDIFSQLMWGSQIALTVGLLAAGGSIGIGTIIGLVSGYSGGRIDSVLMRFTDVILVLPGLPFLIILAAVLGPSYWNIIFVLTIIGWPGTARVIRSEVLSLKERPFIDSARVTGASNIRIMFKHLAPNVMPLAFLYMTLAVSGSILSEAALSFLGLGDVNTASWGQMLQAVQTENVLAAWWWLLPPGIAITFISLAFYLIGRAFEQIVNPRLRKR